MATTGLATLTGAATATGSAGGVAGASSAALTSFSIASDDDMTLTSACFSIIAAVSATLAASWATAWPREAASRLAIAALIFCTSPLAFAASSAATASSTPRSSALMASRRALCSASRWADLALKASSIGLRKASQSFCSCLRSIGTLCASACQRCCSARTASMRKLGMAPSALASSIMAWRRVKLAFCAASMPACAPLMASFHRGWSSA